MPAVEELDNESDRNKEKIDENKDFVTKSENDLKVQREFAQIALVCGKLASLKINRFFYKPFEFFDKHIQD